MDLDIIITSAIIIAFCVIPMIVINVKQNLKKKRTREILHVLAKDKSVEIESTELCGDLGVGITKNKEGFVFYNKHENGFEEKHFILLSDIKSCNFIRTNLSSSSIKIKKLILNFEYHDKSKAILSLEFYNSDENFQLSGELQLVEKWKPIVDRAIEFQTSIRRMTHTQKRTPKAIAV